MILKKWIPYLSFLAAVLSSESVMGQCPVNINFGDKTLNNWFAYTGSFQQNSNRVVSNKLDYPASAAYPQGTIGAVSITENGSSIPGIQVNTSGGTDAFGGFSIIPNINGYQYDYSILLGSTNVSSNPNGGFVRGIGYVIDVPAGTGPYTMTYAYAMVLENGSHASSQQPLASATLMTNDSIITCASPQYFLPTNSGALDVATATRNGFKLSNVPTPNSNLQNNQSPYRVWTKNWTEVTFDLEPYRGQKVTLTFTAENCVPRGHFAYAYIALRNDCNGLMISGARTACVNGPTTYSIPELTGATYQWTVPNGWKITSDSNSNIITVIPGIQSGFITAREQNSCANLEATIQVTTSPPTVAGNLTGNAIVCAGANATPIALSGNTGNVLKWLSSTDGINWADISNATNTYLAQNLNATTRFIALVQNGPSCSIDTAKGATVVVDAKSVGGTLTPNDLQICQDQNKDATLRLINYNGGVVNWQLSADAINWANFAPAKTDTFYNITGVLAPTRFRVVVKNGVCAADTSSVSTVGIFNERFPKAAVSPIDTTICFGTSTNLIANITIGTNYTWTNASTIYNSGNGQINNLPFSINAKAAPTKSTTYVLSVKNGNCPNLLIDTFTVNVIPPVTVNAGRDTMVVLNQPLQLKATTSFADSIGLSYLWQPATYLNNPTIINPIATITNAVNTVVYTVKATTPEGCIGEDAVRVTVFKTQPDFFIPTGFTPNGDGKNDILKPIAVGISSIKFFSVYNRFGQLLFTTKEFGKGWDGLFNNTAQPSGTYIFTAQGVDYTGKIVDKRGTSVLIR
jgi:gliding motility-associated-like protein